MKKKKKKKPDPAAPPVTSLPETQSLDTVLRAAMQHQADALMLQWSAEAVGREFRGTESSPPRKLLLLPGGAKYRVEIEDVLSLEARLYALSSEARRKLNALYQLRVPVDADIVARDAGPSGPFMPTPPNESITENPACRAAQAVATNEPTRKAK